MCILDYMVRACFYDREKRLRRDEHRWQGNAVTEGIVRYGHQGGGQRQAGHAKLARRKSHKKSTTCSIDIIT